MSADNANLPPDYHSHTRLCKHAEGTPADYWAAAKAKGISQLACTDHVPTPHDFSPDIRMSMDDFPQYKEWVEALKQEAGDGVLFGIEADFYQGGYSFLERFIQENEFDLVLGSVHFQNYWADDEANRSLWANDNVLSTWKRYFGLIGLMAETGLYDIAAHLDLPKKRGPQPPVDEIREFVLPALDKIATAGMCIEINTSGLIHKTETMYPSPEILSWACERKIPITFGSDAHKPERVGADFDKAVALARGAGYREYAVFNQRNRTLQPLGQ